MNNTPESDMPDNQAVAATTSMPKLRRPPLLWKMRIALIAFGTLVGLVLLEIFLRSLGFVYYHEKQHRPGNHPEDAFVILCVGDSCTYGQGPADERQQNYPAQLQHILDTRHPDGKYRVVNMGFPGANSSQVVRRFEGWLRLHDPDLAIILIGNNDVWNQNESFSYLIGTGKRAKLSRRLRTRLRIWGDSLRVVRLARCVALSLDDDRERAKNWNPDEDTSPSKGRFRRGREVLGEIERVEELYRLNFKRISKIARDYDVDLLWLDYHLPAKFGETDYIDSVLEELGAPYIDLRPFFSAGEKIVWGLISRDEWHPNQLGYAVFARAIYNKLIEMGHATGPPISVLANLSVQE